MGEALGVANDQTINEEPPAPFELWTEWQWLTTRKKAEPFPF
jgi:hypothetical protein